MHIPSLIEKKRDGGVLTGEEIDFIIGTFTRGELADAQMSALAMAIYFRGLSPEETADLTRAMLHSGDVFHYPESAPGIVDKHSTGGIGDKISLILAPLLACDDLWVPMISGRGLGITGGTLDKLESIPGFNVSLSQVQAIEQLETIGVVMMGQTAAICPADKKLYALRDVTGTVPSQALIVASIMSKKLAESLDSLVLDVKFGSGAFMKTRADAESLAEALQNVGESMGVRTSALLTPMNEPLGQTVGNALEVGEAIDTLRGGGPPDVRQLTLDLAEAVSSRDRATLEGWLEDGSAWEKFIRLVEAQEGEADALDDFSEVHPAPVIRECLAPASGVISAMDAETIGRAAVELGAGRSRAEDPVDFAVGFSSLAKVGAAVSAGDPVGTIHARDDSGADRAESAFRKAWEIT